MEHVTLDQWMDRTGATCAGVASRLGLSPSYVSRLRAGLRRPKIETMLDIERMTAGAVPVSAWVAQRRYPTVNDATATEAAE